MKWRKAAKIDNNQISIVNKLRGIGYSVETGKDDILVGCKGKTYWYEIKNPEVISKKTGEILESSKKKKQIRLEREWKGHYKIVTSIDEIIEDLVR